MIKQSLNGVEALLLVGGPAGCGKTTTADRIVKSPDCFHLPIKCPTPLHRTDWKSLTSKQFHEGTVIIEFATNKLSDPAHLQTYNDFITALEKAAPIRAGYTVEIDRKTMRMRYLQRMKPSHFMHFGKWKSLIRYLFAMKSDDFGIAIWNELLAGKSIKRLTWPIPPRTADEQPNQKA